MTTGDEFVQAENKDNLCTSYRKNPAKIFEYLLENAKVRDNTPKISGYSIIKHIGLGAA